MISRFRNLRAIGSVLVFSAFLSSALATVLWTQSSSNWTVHQKGAYIAGITLFNAMQNGTTPAQGVQLVELEEIDLNYAGAGDFHRITGAPQAARITIVPISADAANTITGKPITLAILSPDLIYKLANLPHRKGQTAAETTGEVFRLLASFCSDPMVIAQMGDDPWIQIEGESVWGCDAAPTDYRLIAALIFAIAFGILITVALNLSSDFVLFAERLRNRRRVGGPDSYKVQGPQELQSIVAAVNSYLETERTQLESRAAVLSGVSHDLGTPATRLRLRAALITDLELREKLEADIDSMTGMIESVLTYTRSEMSIEASRKLSLTALVEAVVADYQDTGRAVEFRHATDVVVRGGSSVFMSKQGKSTVAGNREIIVTGRPIALGRALTNLIDNALKYGRRAKVSLKTDATSATIIVEDEGSESSAKEIEALLAPFKRGTNTAMIDGNGLGLTIVATIANLHGGSLSFEDTATGVSACFMMQRN